MFSGGRASSVVDFGREFMMSVKPQQAYDTGIIEAPLQAPTASSAPSLTNLFRRSMELSKLYVCE